MFEAVSESWIGHWIWFDLGGRSAWVSNLGLLVYRSNRLWKSLCSSCRHCLGVEGSSQISSESGGVRVKLGSVLNLLSSHVDMVDFPFPWTCRSGMGGILQLDHGQCNCCCSLEFLDSNSLLSIMKLHLVCEVTPVPWGTSSSIMPQCQSSQAWSLVGVYAGAVCVQNHSCNLHSSPRCWHSFQLHRKCNPYHIHCPVKFLKYKLKFQSKTNLPLSHVQL